MNIKVKVKQALKEDRTKNYVRLSKKLRDKLGIKLGESVEVKKKEHSLELKVVKADKDLLDLGDNACRINAFARKKLKVDTGDTVLILKKSGDESPTPFMGKINAKKYDVVIVEKNTDIPFQVSTKMINIAWKTVRRKREAKSKAKVLFDWMQKNIKYGTSRRRGIGYRDSIETKVDHEGVCGEQAFLYIALARIVGLTSNYVTVDKDFRGRSVKHACASVLINGKLVLVDPAYHTFDISHKKYKVLKDEYANIAFKSMRKGRPILIPRII